MTAAGRRDRNFRSSLFVLGTGVVRYNRRLKEHDRSVAGVEKLHHTIQYQQFDAFWNEMKLMEQ